MNAKIEEFLGVWKAEPYESRGKKAEMVIELTREKIIITGFYGGVEQPKMEFVHTIRLANESTLILESIIPQANNVKVEFKFEKNGEGFTFTDPDKRIIKISKM